MDYKINWWGATSFWKGRNGQQPVAVVDHIIQGFLKGAHARFNDPNDPDGGASAHFGVGLDGTIVQWVKIEDAAWANGVVNQPNTSIPWLADAVRRKINLNNLTVSVEHEGFTGNPMPEAQYQATLWLHRRIFAAIGVAPSETTLIRHRDIDRVNRPFCPGEGFPHDRLLADLRKGAPVDSMSYDSYNELSQKNERLTVNRPFLDFFLNGGGVKVFGLPITPEVKASVLGLDKNGDGQAVTAQVFERYILEYTKGGEVRGSDAGRQALHALLAAASPKR